MAISLLSSTPANGATDYFINKSVELTFDKAIGTSSLTNNVFSIIDQAAGTNVPLTIQRDYSSSAKIILQPSTVLKENTEYRIVIMGTDMGLGYSLVAEDNDTLTTTITVTFRTGDTVYSIDTTVEKQADNISAEGDLFLPTNVKALGFDFTVEQVRPKNNTHGVPVTLTGDNTVRFTFSKDLYTGAVDFTEWLDVDPYPLLNHDAYLASGSSLGEGTIPGHNITVTGADLLVTFDTELPKNVAVQITLSEDILASDGATYGGGMQYSINTELYPEIYGVKMIKREVREVVDTFTEDYIGALLFKNTMWSWEKVGRSFELSNPSFAARQYIMYSTILDLMEDREYAKFVVAGTRRQLGDLNVSVDNIIGRIAMKVAKYQKAKDDAFESMVSGWQFRVGSTTLGYSEIADQINRLWYDISGRYTQSRYKYYQPNIPSANLYMNRRAKTNNPLW